MLIPKGAILGAGDSRCLTCKSQHCFVCEHRKTAEEILNESNYIEEKIFEKDQLNPLFIISNNITSNNNDPRCMTCRSQHCFKCEHKKLETALTNTNNATTTKKKYNFKRLFIVSNNLTSNYFDSRCFSCRSNHCFQCEHKPVLSKTKIAPERAVAVFQQPVRALGVSKIKPIEEKKSTICCCCC